MKRCAALLALTLTAPVGISMLTPAPLLAQKAPVTDLSTTKATATAKQLLTALEQRRGDVIHASLSPAVKGSLSPQQVQDRLNQLPAILSSRIVLVASGYRTTTVDALLKTARGEEDLLLVLDDDGKLLAWKWVDAVQPIERTALDFAADLAAGRWLAARSKLSLDLQEDLAPDDLRRKWLKLSSVAGGFRQLKDAVIASQGGDQQLVLVSIEFGNATSNLFVIFDERGQIINGDISRDFV